MIKLSLAISMVTFFVLPSNLLEIELLEKVNRVLEQVLSII